jgi:hypothetical protein
MKRQFGAVLFGVALTLFLAWILAAFSFQFERFAVIACTGALALVGMLCVLARRNFRHGWMAFILCLASAMLWWSTIAPQQDLAWAPDTAQGVTAEFQGDTVIVHNIRDFVWEDENTAAEQWKSETYSLNAISSVDLLTSVWSSPAIAHVLISFGFFDGRYLAFSAEIRREADEEFSSIGGFFKKFELVLIAAEERDIVKLRTNYRSEDVSLFPLRLTPEQARRLLVSYLERGNQLAAEPEFYNTVTANCTTVIFRLARLVDPGLPFDWRVLASGYLPAYLFDLGAIDTTKPLGETLEDARITLRAVLLTPSEDYSTGIRR